jgi:glycosyltransferase involved in cell wall biosynthesis
MVTARNEQLTVHHQAHAQRVSLHVAVFNTQKYVEAAVRSILNQTFRDFDLVLWDDGSTDGSAAILQKLAASDSRIRVFTGQHTGVASAHAQAIAAGDGAYIGWIDSDDLLAPTALAETVAALDQDPAAGFVYTDYFDMDESGKRTRLGQRCKIPYSQDRLLVDFMTFHFRLLRRSAFEAAGGMELAVQNGAEDYDLCLRMAECGEICHIAKPLYYYRSRPTSFSSRQRLEQIQASEQAVRRALTRRELNDKMELAVKLSAKFLLLRKPGPKPLAPTQAAQPTLNIVRGNQVSLKRLNVSSGRSRIVKPVDSVPRQRA